MRRTQYDSGMDTVYTNPDLPLPSTTLDAHGCVIHNTFEMIGGRVLVEHVSTEVPEILKGANDGEQIVEIDKLAG